MQTEQGTKGVVQTRFLTHVHVGPGFQVPGSSQKAHHTRAQPNTAALHLKPCLCPYVPRLTLCIYDDLCTNIGLVKVCDEDTAGTEPDLPQRTHDHALCGVAQLLMHLNLSSGICLGTLF